MSYVESFEGGFQVVFPHWLVVPLLRRRQSPIRIWQVNYWHLHLQSHREDRCDIGSGAGNMLYSDRATPPLRG